MPIARAVNLSQQLLPWVHADLAAQLTNFDWQSAQVVERGKDHTILIAPDVAVARVPRRDDPDLARKMHLLEQLQLPWQVPTPLSEVHHGVLQTYIPGTAQAHGSGNPEVVAEIVSGFEQYDTSGVSLNVPFAQRRRLKRSRLTALDTVVSDHM